MTPSSPRRVFALVATTLGLVYLATLAPGVTLWDAGEFASAVESLGIPHPPGTPLFILIARTWRLALRPLPTALATNLLAAVCTALAAGLAASLVARWVRDASSAVAGGIAFGVMSTVWLNATETEVYSASLLMSVLMIHVGYRAGRDRREQRIADPRPVPARTLGRYDMVLAYLFALTPPLHLSAMVASPAAIALATIDRDLRLDGRRAIMLVGAAMLATGAGTGGWALAATGGAFAVLPAISRRWRGRTVVALATVVGIVAVGTSACLFMLVRARLDPAINQGDPSTLAGVVDVMARTQYDVPGLWPRRAPLWLQVGNLIQYADWQFAFGLDQWVGMSPVRTPVTVLYVALGIAGSVWHRRRDRQTWVVLVVLLASATIGVVLYLNLKAGPSFGYGVLPPNADREARERDYFFALGFATFGLWVGMGAMRFSRWLARRTGRRLARVGFAVAVLPVVLNWHAVNRRREPAASLPNAFARATLESAPPGAVLFVAGDNDTYPLWYAQVAGHVRPDVSIVTVPLIPAEWYRAELARRHALYEPADTGRWKGTPREIASVARRAVLANRPVAAGVALEPELRAALGDRWTFRGLSYVLRRNDAEGSPTSIDINAVDSTAAIIRRLLPGPAADDRVDDPAGRYLISLLACPTLAKRAALGTTGDSARLLASRCNFR